MPNYRRNFVAGGTFFFTVVTANRQPILASPSAIDLLRDAADETRQHYAFKLTAWVILPDHLHMIWAMPPGDHRFDQRWSSIKQNFTRRWRAADGAEQHISDGLQREGRRGVWQPRYIEHTIRDEDDLEQHIDYIHFNPVKHGYVNHPIDWPHSSLHHYIKKRWLPVDWGTNPGDADRIAQPINTDVLDS